MINLKVQLDSMYGVYIYEWMDFFICVCPYMSM